ncbi:MAG: MotA/TolQ/ExbB proton channel family protein [Draconibacterium sp.]|nr:MotA/TolQ/ExbB proton channel family protein [Draconibacterium sp.]
MNVIELFKMGGVWFMSIVTIFGMGMLLYSVKIVIEVFVKKEYDGKGVNYILMFGSLAFIIGLLGQAVGMFEAFAAIQAAGDISPALIAGGLRVSMITPFYGIIYFILSIPIWVVLREKIKMHKQD